MLKLGFRAPLMLRRSGFVTRSHESEDSATGGDCKQLRIVSLALLAAVALSACSSETSIKPSLSFDAPIPEFGDVQIGRMQQWSGELAPDGEVEIINPYGDVYIRHNRGGRNVGISGVIQRLGDPAPEEMLDLRASRNHVRLEVSYPESASTSDLKYGRFGRVDLAVLVPEGSTLRVRTRDGSITGKRVRSNIEARTDSGRISLSSTGWLDAESGSGDIELVLIGERWTRGHRAHTRTGSIAFEFPTKAVMQIDARSAGTLSVEPEALAAYVRSDNGHIHGTWGDAPEVNRIEAVSETGDINISLYGWMRDAVAKPPAPTSSDNHSGEDAQPAAVHGAGTGEESTP